jgi:hypothetical protein
MRFVGLALISALPASGAAWGCQNAAPLPGTSEAPFVPAPSTGDLAAGAERAPPALSEAASASGATPRVTRVALQGHDSRGSDSRGSDSRGSDSLGGDPSGHDPADRDSQERLLAGNPSLTGERLLRDPLIGDTLIGDGEPMDDVDDAASGVSEPEPAGLAKPDPDQAGAPVEPPSFPRPARLSPEGSSGGSPEGSLRPGAGQVEPRGTALENQQR